MTGRERLLRVFAGKAVDRVPVVPFIHVNCVKEYHGSHDVDPAEATVDVYEEYGFDIIHRNCTPKYDHIGGEDANWRVEQRTETFGRDVTTTTAIRTPGGNLREVHRLCWTSEYDAESTAVEYLIKSQRDLELMMEFQPPAETFEASPILRAKQSVGEKGVVAPWYPGAFANVAYYYRAVDELLLDAMTNPGMYHKMMRHFVERSKGLLAQYVAAGVDLISYGGNIASGKMVGESFFRSFVLPYENELIDFVQSQGVVVLYHNCGYARALLEAYRDMPMKAYESLTPPPYGDTEIDEAIAVFRPEVSLFGNIDQIEFLRTATPGEVKAEVRTLLKKVKIRGNFIIATTDYLSEGTPPENLYAMAEAGHEYGEYV